VVLVLVSGGGLPAGADLAGGPVDGPRAGALDALAALAAGQTGRRRPRWMFPVPLHLGQRPNGARYRNPTRAAMTASMAKTRWTVTVAHPSPQLAAPAE